VTRRTSCSLENASFQGARPEGRRWFDDVYTPPILRTPSSISKPLSAFIEEDACASSPDNHGPRSAADYAVLFPGSAFRFACSLRSRFFRIDTDDRKRLSPRVPDHQARSSSSGARSTPEVT
jgi:hypothetical protein